MPDCCMKNTAVLCGLYECPSNNGEKTSGKHLLVEGAARSNYIVSEVVLSKLLHDFSYLGLKYHLSCVLNSPATLLCAQIVFRVYPRSFLIGVCDNFSRVAFVREVCVCPKTKCL